MSRNLKVILEAKGFPFVEREDGRLFQIPKGGEDDLDDPLSESDDVSLDGDDEDGEGGNAEVERLKAQIKERDDRYGVLEGQLQNQNLQIAELRGGYNAIEAERAARREAPAAEPEIADATEDQIAKALEDGDYKEAARLTKLAATAAATRSSRLLEATSVNPLRKTFSERGLPALAEMRVRDIVMDLSPLAQKVFKENKKVILEHMALLDPEAQLNERAIKALIATHTGATMIEGDTWEQTVQAEVDRRMRGDVAPTVTPTGRGITRVSGNQEPNWEQMFGAEAAAAAREYGGFDGYAQKVLGYKDMKTYAKATGVIA